jgi:hypothetical protein
MKLNNKKVKTYIEMEITAGNTSERSILQVTA